MWLTFANNTTKNVTCSNKETLHILSDQKKKSVNHSPETCENLLINILTSQAFVSQLQKNNSVTQVKHDLYVRRLKHTWQLQRIIYTGGN